MAGRRTTEAGPLVASGPNVVREWLRSAVPLTCVLHARRGARLEGVLDLARARRVPIQAVDEASLARVAGTPHHQGVVASGPPYPYAALETITAAGCRSVLVIDGVQDPRNLGAILRTARAAGVGGVVLPRDRSVGVTGTVAVTSAGLVFGLVVARVTNLVRAMEALREAGFWLVGLAADAPESLYTLDRPDRPAIVVGGEGEGLRPLVRRACDFLVSLPMAAGVDSLNASVAAGIAIYEIVVRAGSANAR